MKTIQITFDDLAHSHAKAAAHRAHMTLGDFVRLAVEQQVRRREGTPEGNLDTTGGAR